MQADTHVSVVKRKAASHQMVKGDPGADETLVLVTGAMQSTGQEVLDLGDEVMNLMRSELGAGEPLPVRRELSEALARP